MALTQLRRIRQPIESAPLILRESSNHKIRRFPVDQNSPRIVDLDLYYASPVECCVALGISQPTLTKLIRENKLRSIKIGRTRLIEKPAD